MPEKRCQNDNEHKRPTGGADRDSPWRARIAASLRVIPNFSDTDKDENERPVCPENGQRIESRAPVVQEKESTDRDEDDREDEGDSPGIAVLGHGRPPLPCTTHAKGK